MDIRKCVLFLEEVIQTIEWSAERLNARLSSLGPTETLNLARKLNMCSTIAFMKYIKILSIGQTNAVGDRTLPFVASNLYAPQLPRRKAKRCHSSPAMSLRAGTSAAFPHSSDETLKPVDSQLGQFVHSLPPELFSNMLQIFLHTVFGPRKIYLGVEHLNLHVLRALDRAMYAKQQSILLSGSVWVIGQGNYEDTIGFLNRMPKSSLRWQSEENMEWYMFQELRARLEGPEVDMETARLRSDKIDRKGLYGEGPEWLKLQKAVQKLPLDVNLLIRDALHEDVFGPGKEIIFPIGGESHLQNFRALDRQLHNKYHYIYYSRNMWLIEEGPADWLIQYAYEFMPYQFSQIRNLTLKLTRKDYYWEGVEVEQFIDWRVEEGGAEGMDNQQAVCYYSTICAKAAHELKLTWWKKLDQVSQMDLDYLIIDARDAFASDGEYLALETAHDCNWSKYSNFPAFLQVLAPDSGLADLIYDTLIAKSSSDG